MKSLPTRIKWRIRFVIVAGIGVLALCTPWMLAPAPPFDFLREMDIVRDKQGPPAPGPFVLSINGQDHNEFSACYTVHRDFSEVRAKVEQELFARGFTLRREGMMFGTYVVDYSRKHPDKEDSYYGDFVSLSKDVRCRTATAQEDGFITDEIKPGWTKVGMVLWVRQSPAEIWMHRCREAITGQKQKYMQGPE